MQSGSLWSLIWASPTNCFHFSRTDVVSIRLLYVENICSFTFKATGVPLSGFHTYFRQLHSGLNFAIVYWKSSVGILNIFRRPSCQLSMSFGKNVEDRLEFWMRIQNALRGDSKHIVIWQPWTIQTLTPQRSFTGALDPVVLVGVVPRLRSSRYANSIVSYSALVLQCPSHIVGSMPNQHSPSAKILGNLNLWLCGSKLLVYGIMQFIHVTRIGIGAGLWWYDWNWSTTLLGCLNIYRIISSYHIRSYQYNFNNKFFPWSVLGVRAQYCLMYIYLIVAIVVFDTH